MNKAAILAMMSHGQSSRYENGRDEREVKRHDEHAHTGGTGAEPMKMDRECAEKWVSHMDKPDGSGKGGKWTYEQTEQLRKQKGIGADGPVFYAVLNMLHSDYGKTLAKYGVTTPEAYAELAMDWIDDDDVEVGDMKTALYYHYIVK